jgi:hypothetical protein
MCAKIAFEKFFPKEEPVETWEKFYKAKNPAITLCGKDAEFCWNGLCLPTNMAKLCPPVPACPDSAPIRLEDGSCQEPNSKAEPDKTFAKSGTTCASGLIMSPCPRYHGCKVNQKFCPGSSTNCVAKTGTCPTEITACQGDCESKALGLPQSVYVSQHQTVTLPISIDAQNNVRSMVTIPAGAFGKDAKVTIEPVSGNEWVNSESVVKVLSTPFRCKAEGASTKMNLTLNAPVDRKKYGKAIERDKKIRVDCRYQGVFTLRDFSEDAPCSGESTIFEDKVMFKVNPEGKCADIHWQSEEDDLEEAKEVVPGRYFLKFKKSGQCFHLFNSADNDFLYVFFKNVTDANSADACTIDETDKLSKFEKDVAFKQWILTTSFDSPDYCSLNNDLTLIQDQDICLATVSGASFSCVEKWNERKYLKIAVDSSGNNRFEARFPTCDGQTTYAFVNVPLPPPPVEAAEELGMCDAGQTGVNPCVVAGAVGGTLFVLFALGSFALWRLMRYRIKYRQEKELLDELADRAAELDEFAGGLGVASADEDVDMIANPLVIEMQELEEQIKRVNEDMGVQLERDAQQIDNLEMERQRLHAEIERVKKEMQKANQNSAPRRAAELPSFGGNPGATGGVAAGVGGPAANTVQTAKPTVRHDFGQVNRAKKKKL